MVYEVYKIISSKNKLTNHYRSVMMKKSVSSNINFFLQLQMFSADMSHKYDPSKLNHNVRSRLAEYFMSPDKDFNFIYDLQIQENSQKRNNLSIRFKDKNIPKEEQKLVNDFLNKFIVQDKSSNELNIDLDLSSKVLPKRLTLHNLHKMDLINFAQMQKSLISFFNDD